MRSANDFKESSGDGKITQALRFFAPGVAEDEGEGDPPGEVVGEEGEAGDPGEFAVNGGVEEADGAEDFSEKTDEDDGPVADGVISRDGVADAVDPDDHADALPEAEVVGDGHSGPLEGEAREEDGEGPPGDVVDRGEDEDEEDPTGGGGMRHGEPSSMRRFACDLEL